MENEDYKMIIIDFCGTITKNQTADRFVFYAMKKTIKNLFLYTYKFFYQRFISFLKKFNLFQKINTDKTIYLSLIKGLTKDLLEKKAKEYADFLIKKKMRITIIERINEIHYDKCVIASAGYEIYIKYFNDKYFNCDILASKFLYDEDKFNGKIDRTVYHLDKADYLIETYGLSVINKYSTFYSDSESDLPTFNIVKNKIVVYPKKRFLNYAKNQKWTIIN